jgi:bifunctional non-homologous end joining protein LigD
VPPLPKPPAGSNWIHEIKHDGYRLVVQKDQKRVRLFTHNGHDWTDRYPLIVDAALSNRSASFVIDGEAVLLGVDGVSDFDGLHSRQHDDEVQLYAFDALMLDGDNLRKLPLAMRKTNLARLLARRPDGIFVSDFEQGEIGPELFCKACEFGLEGLVSKHRDRTCRAATSPHWVKGEEPEASGHDAGHEIVYSGGDANAGSCCITQRPIHRTTIRQPDIPSGPTLSSFRWNCI